MALEGELDRTAGAGHAWVCLKMGLQQQPAWKRCFVTWVSPLKHCRCVPSSKASPSGSGYTRAAGPPNTSRNLRGRCGCWDRLCVPTPSHKKASVQSDWSERGRGGSSCKEFLSLYQTIWSFHVPQLLLDIRTIFQHFPLDILAA